MPVRDYEPVIGLEVHCQLRTRTKMFSRCAFAYGAPANSQTDPYTLGLPGTLPVPNRQAVEYAIMLALALGCTVETDSRWARKHYFYPDLPKGYQITQSDHPYARGGRVVIPDGEREGELREVALTRIHLEEDAGKNLHVEGEAVSLLDFNRAGAPLVEVVGEPQLRSAREAVDYLRQLRAIVRWLDISDANMEEGSLRCDANVSLRRRGASGLGTRCEIKNLNSFKFLESAILAEIRRQADLLDAGEEVRQGTMAYDVERDRTWMMRSKEEAADYRYFPEPDLPPLILDEAWIAAIRDALPELPEARVARYRVAGLSDYDARVLTAEPALARYFDDAAASGQPAKKLCNWICGELLAQLHRDGRSIADSPVPAADLAGLVALVESATISGAAAKQVFQRMYAEGRSPAEVVEREGLGRLGDPALLRAIVEAVVAEHPEQLAQYRAGKSKVRGFFYGQCMARSQRRADPQVLDRLLDEALDGGARGEGEAWWTRSLRFGR